MSFFLKLINLETTIPGGLKIENGLKTVLMESPDLMVTQHIILMKLTNLIITG